MSPNMRGALLMTGSMACFTINDAFIKLMAGALALPQLLTIRGILASVFVFVIAVGLGRLRFGFSGRDWIFIGVRSIAEIAAAYFFLTALFNMPLANVSAVLQVLPLVVSLGAWLVFGEALGWRRLAAIGVGFFGVLLIIKPGLAGFTIWSLYALCAVLSVMVRDLVTRCLSPEVTSLGVTLVTAIVVTAGFGAISLGQDWVALDTLHWLYMLASAVFVVGAYLFSVQVMRIGEISFVAPFRYTSLLCALILGFLVFGDWPDALTLAGAGIVVGAGLFTLWRENRAAQAEARDVAKVFE